MATRDTALEPSRTEVLVVGAGPTGLTMAAALAKWGVRARTIDKSAARTEYSQAIGVQAGTLEALGESFGDELPQRMVAAGFPVRDGYLHFGTRPQLHVNFSGIPSVYNFVLALAQSETERLLEEQVTRRSQAVERLTELVSLTDSGSHVAAQLKHADGREERIVADFVVGCDGAHSTVRHEAGIPFAGGAYTGEFVLGDVTLRWSLPYDAAQIFLSRNGILACLPMRGDPGHYRLILISAARVAPGPDRDDLSPDEFCRILKPLAPVDIPISEYVWLTRFRLHHRMAQRFQSGRLFLAGDAGHIHSPVGAQGMNTGIQDALSLASKLAAVLRSGAPVGLLADYEKERLPVARSVVRGTDLAFRIASHANRGFSGWLRETIGPRVITSSFFQKRVGRGVSQVDVARHDIDIRAKLAQRIASGEFKRGV